MIRTLALKTFKDPDSRKTWTKGYFFNFSEEKAKRLAKEGLVQIIGENSAQELADANAQLAEKDSIIAELQKQLASVGKKADKPEKGDKDAK